jgi:GTP-binding protein
VLDAALQAVSERDRRVTTAQLNKLLRESVAKHPPASKPGKWLKFYYATQADTSPPTFIFFCNDPQQIHFSYRRYLENELREVFGFQGTPIRMSFRGREDDR